MAAAAAAPPPPPPLPILQYRARLLELVAASPVAVVIGETGSGKTTQLAQYLLAAGLAGDRAVGVTQPRRVAAVSVARRVAQEMDVQLGEVVGYSIRFEDRTSSRTRIKYLTDGCLLRECLDDPQLSNYSILILDEAHERSLNTDILFGLLKKLVSQRQPGLKLVITSATLDGQHFSKFFDGCPVLNVPGRLFPVQILHSLEKPTSYLESAVETVLDIHRRQPEGDILLFMTGQDEIEKTIKKVQDKISSLQEGECMDALILPLHASLPPEFQARVFMPPPAHCRRIIVATNIAETSLTMDGIVYVIDPGVVKQRQYNPVTGMDSLVVVPISRVQATQRAGRAGRTRPGKCYRLYPKSHHDQDLPEVTVPEIQRSSLAAVALHLKSLELEAMDLLNFEFLDRPSTEALEDALRQLYVLDAINGDGKITVLGKQMAVLPLEPALARTLLAALELGCLRRALSVVAMLSCESLHFEGPRQDRATDKTRGRLPDGDGLGDHIMLLQIWEAWEQAGFDVEWCKQRGLHLRSMRFAKDVRKQLATILEQKLDRRGRSDKSAADSTRRNESADKQGQPSTSAAGTQAVRRAICLGSAGRLARRMPKHNGYRTVNDKAQLVQLHPSTAALKVDDDGLLPEWVIYHEIVATTRPFMRSVCVVEESWVAPLLPKLHNVNVRRLSGRPASDTSAKEGPCMREGRLPAQVTKERVKLEGGDILDAARERFLARKRARAA
eukprot:SM000009S23449  [mRNA]  locus=s9:45710:49660:- [translate_table: standard]